MRNRIKKFTGLSGKSKILFASFIFIAFSSLTLRLSSQTYPVSGTLNFQPPYSVYFNEFTDPARPRIQLLLNFNDLAEPALDVQLRFFIEGNGIQLRTTPSWTPDALTLLPGSNLITADLLEPYFNLDHLDVVGIPEANLAQTGRLPEGFYTFCVEVLESGRQKVISQQTCGAATLRLNYPPIPLAPADLGTVSAAGAQNILFNWISNHDPAIAAEYELTIVNVPAGLNPNDAINSAGTPVLDAQTVNSTSFVYGPAEVPLIAGQKYAWRVKAADPMGFSTFENNGLSPVFSFTYGFNTGGSIPLTAPPDEYKVESVTGVGLVWGGPDNTVNGQSLVYKVKAVKMNQNESKDAAILRSNAVLDEELPPTVQHYGGTITINEELLPDEFYCWQVKAYTDEIEVAASPVFTFRTPPIIEEVHCANGTAIVKIDKITKSTKINEDNYTGLEGVGIMPLDAAGNTATINFSNISVSRIAGVWTLATGMFEAVKEDYQPLDAGANGDIKFHRQSYRLRKDGYYQYGTVEWKYPLPVNGGSQPVVLSKTGEVNFTFFNLSGGLNFGDNPEIPLLNPMGFKVSYTSEGFFLISGEKVSLNLVGKITLPDNIKTVSGTPLPLPFSGTDNPFYFLNPGFNPESNILFVKGSTVQMEPKKVAFDFSESKSGGAFATDPSWKGIFFNEFNIIMPKDGDGSRQLVLNESISAPVAEATSESKFAAVNGGGLQANFSAKFDSLFATDAYSSFNTFKSRLRRLDMKIENGMPNQSGLYGNIVIPFLSRSRTYDYKMPVAANGFQDGYLEKGVEGLEVTVAEKDPKSRFIYKINQCVFKDKSALKMNVDMKWPYFGLEINRVPDLCLWGNENFGFTSPDGMTTLATQVNGRLDAFPLVIDRITAKKKTALFFFAFDGKIVLPGGAGKAGGVDFHVEMDVSPKNAASGKGGGDEEEEADANQFQIAPIDIEISTPTMEVSGHLEYTVGDSLWGAKFEAKLQGAFKQPAPFGVLVHVIIGSVGYEEADQFGYWYVRCRVNGINVALGPTGLAIDGADIAVYHHLRHRTPDEREADGMASLEEEEEPGFTQKYEEKDPDADPDEDEGMEGWGEEGDFDYKPDVNSHYGFSAKLGIKDAASMGQPVIKVLCYAGLEMTFTKDGSITYVAVMADFYFSAEAQDPFTQNAGYAKGKLEYWPAIKRWVGLLDCGFKYKGEKPTVCVMGKIEIDIGPSAWEFSIGKIYDPVKVALGSCDGIQLRGYLGINATRIKLGVGIYPEWDWSSPTLDFVVVKANLTAAAEAHLKIDAVIEYEPFVFKGKLTAGASAELRANWWTPLKSGSLVILGASLEGVLDFLLPELCMAGSLEGSITILGTSHEFEMSFKYTKSGISTGGGTCW